MQVSFKQSPQAARATTKSSDVTRMIYASRAVPMAARNAVVGLIEVADGRSRSALYRGGASEGESKCYVLTRFDAFVLIVTDIGRPTHGHTDGYDGLGLGLNRYVKICMCYRSNSVYTRPGSAYIYAFIYKAQA